MRFLCILFLFIYNIAYSQEYQVYIFLAEECPISIYMMNPVKDAISCSADKTDFSAVFPLPSSNAQKADSFLTAHKLSEMEIIIDDNHLLKEKYQVNVVPTAVVVNKGGELIYKGRISNAYYAPGRRTHRPLTNELKQVLQLLINKNVKPSEPWPRAIGCFIPAYE